MGGVLDSSAAKLAGLLAAVVTLVVILVSKPVREALLDTYQADWPAVAAVGAALVLAAWLSLRKRGMRVVTDSSVLQKELHKTVESAKETLVCVGSRSRDVEYLRSIVRRVSTRPSVTHHRILCGMPAHAALKTHLEELAKMPTPRIAIGLLDMDVCEEPEQSLCASERRAVVVVPQLGEYGAYESALVITDRVLVQRAIKHAESLLGVATRLKATEVAELPTTRTRRVQDDAAP